MSYMEEIERRGYKKEELSEKNKAFVEGMEYVLNEVLTKDFFGEGDFDEVKDFSPTMAVIAKELSENTLECVRAMIECTIADVIMSLSDVEEE